MRWLIGIILGEIICKSSNWQHIQRLKITILGANWQLFKLERIAKCSYFILSTQNIKFYWFVMKIKRFLLPIWWYNRGSFPLGNKYFGVFVLNGKADGRLPMNSHLLQLRLLYKSQFAISFPELLLKFKFLNFLFTFYLFEYKFEWCCTTAKKSNLLVSKQPEVQ